MDEIPVYRCAVLIVVAPDRFVHELARAVVYPVVPDDVPAAGARGRGTIPADLLDSRPPRLLLRGVGPSGPVPAAAPGLPVLIRSLQGSVVVRKIRASVSGQNGILSVRQADEM